MYDKVIWKRLFSTGELQ